MCMLVTSMHITKFWIRLLMKSGQFDAILGRLSGSKVSSATWTRPSFRSCEQGKDLVPLWYQYSNVNVGFSLKLNINPCLTGAWWNRFASEEKIRRWREFLYVLIELAVPLQSMGHACWILRSQSHQRHTAESRISVDLNKTFLENIYIIMEYHQNSIHWLTISLSIDGFPPFKISGAIQSAVPIRWPLYILQDSVQYSLQCHKSNTC